MVTNFERKVHQVSDEVYKGCTTLKVKLIDLLTFGGGYPNLASFLLFQYLKLVLEKSHCPRVQHTKFLLWCVYICIYVPDIFVDITNSRTSSMPILISPSHASSPPASVVLRPNHRQALFCNPNTHFVATLRGFFLFFICIFCTY